MYSKRSASFGLNTNVSLDPAANSKADAKSNQSINNNIVIQTTPTKTREEAVTSENTTDIPAPPEYVSAVPSSAYPEVVPMVYQERSVNIDTSDTNTTDVRDILLEIYESILLTQNKQLLANILSKNSIIISKSDLERVIQAKTGYSCSISTDDDTSCGCCAKVTGIYKIDQIKVDYNDTTLDFKTAFNGAYNELISTYKLSLKYVIA